jgi:hypothetical protein
MSKQIVTVLCEGPHDVAFLVKILKCTGFKSNESTKIGDFPFPMNDLLKTEVQKTDVKGLNLQEVRKVLLPSNTLVRKENYLFLYSMGGDSKKAERQKILKELLLLIAKEGEISPLPADTNLSLLYFYDADVRGVKQRVEEINHEIREIIPQEEPVFSRHGEVKTINHIKFGNFIFSKDDTEKGKLEDILIPLMLLENHTIFDDAKAFLEKHFHEERLFKLKLLEDADKNIFEKRSTNKKDKLKYDVHKSLIGVAGQLQKSGDSNVVAISQTDYLTLNKITNNPKCREILEFFDQFV